MERSSCFSSFSDSFFNQMAQDGFTILMLEDDPNDALLVKRALKKNDITNPIQVLTDGEQGIKYLAGEGKYADRVSYPFPGVIMLDLKMPRKGGLEVLQWLQDHPQFRVIPTVVLTSSKENKDIVQAYHLGANCFLVKPNSFDDMQAMIKKLHEFWTICEKPLAE